MEPVKTTLPAYPEKATLEGRNKVIGFWLFLGGEVVLFGSLFATFIALRQAFHTGPTGEELFDLRLIALATGILLTSSMTSVMAIVGMHRNDVKSLRTWMSVTIFLGLCFLGLEIYEFTHYTSMGHKMSSSPFGSAFYTLVGTHGAHVIGGVIWMILLVARLPKTGLTVVTAPKFYLASLYWHFVDLIWVFVFTVVYLMGKVG
ncbi:cytochrome B oxidoreductase [Ammoniphilus oxalaticus]|uniref:Cytochrome B oxidoreductase n=1 Tax=Ammoniphilus oxalaticus TaxID=66863 RepID=A0A419SEP3_9BACL|nr:cytochrome (ubi)quinol oxidase subunit III [Ammoniphilus oxalaticus]RKD21788.1 cytochrome B oxidoreductase [Ammoniphilus oxalaticus]